MLPRMSSNVQLGNLHHIDAIRAQTHDAGESGPYALLLPEDDAEDDQADASVPLLCSGRQLRWNSGTYGRHERDICHRADDVVCYVRRGSLLSSLPEEAVEENGNSS